MKPIIAVNKKPVKYTGRGTCNLVFCLFNFHTYYVQYLSATGNIC